MSLFLHASEWLDLAKRVPVGQKRRVDHGCGMTRSMDVWNNPESYSAYCHRCQKSGRVRKELVGKIHTSEVIHRKYCNSKDLYTLQELAHKHPDWYRRMVVLLQDKGVSIPVLEGVGFGLRYNYIDHRLVLRLPNIDLGRDCTGYNSAKWLKYYNDESPSYYVLHGTQQPNRIVLTEDTFSAAKITYYTGVSSMCLLGTNIDASKVVQLMTKRVTIATDGDAVGYKSAKRIRQRLEPLGVVCESIIVDGYDPKDLSPKQLKELLHA